jgi:hypothetical protein
MCDVGSYAASGSASCPGMAASGPCDGGGVCTDGVCICSVRFVLNVTSGSCDIRCPVSPPDGSGCSNEGSCVRPTGVLLPNGSGINNGTCVCHVGWWEPLCAAECLGGAATRCAGHGVCDAVTGRCTCSSNASVGYWQLPATGCDECAANSFPRSSCDVTCRDPLCGGHGGCLLLAGATTPSCRCDASDALGYWVVGAVSQTCDNCAGGYHGSRCLSLCNAASACGRVCRGRGTCTSGINGTGTCSCSADTTHGYWAGDGCESCVGSWAGTACLIRCPSSWNGTANATCSGRGRCDDGLLGTGTCTCASPWSSTTNCTDCIDTFCGPSNHSHPPTSIVPFCRHEASSLSTLHATLHRVVVDDELHRLHRHLLGGGLR